MTSKDLLIYSMQKFGKGEIHTLQSLKNDVTIKIVDGLGGFLMKKLKKKIGSVKQLVESVKKTIPVVKKQKKLINNIVAVVLVAFTVVLSFSLPKVEVR